MLFKLIILRLLGVTFILSGLMLVFSQLQGIALNVIKNIPSIIFRKKNK